MKKVEIIKPENVVEDQPLIERRKRSSIQLSIEPKRALYPTILEPQTPEQHKVTLFRSFCVELCSDRR